MNTRTWGGGINHMAKAPKTPSSGITKEFFPSGKVSAVVPYIKGVRVGAGKMFYETGELYAKETYKAGKVESETNYKAGKKEGAAKIYTEAGAVEKSLSYKDDKLVP